MRRGRPNDRELSRFFPRITLSLVAGFLLFLLSSGLYVLPVLLEPAPPGAILDYPQERVRARMQGKVIWFLVGSFLCSALVSARARGGSARKP